MNRIFIAVLMTVLVTVFAFSQNGVIRELSGNVELKHAGSQDFVPASIGASVSSNTIVSTSFRSMAVIEIGSSKITVSPLTRLTLSEIQTSANTENVNLNLQAGRVRVEVNPPAGTRANFNVQSPNASASVRGTSFEMDTNNIYVDKGRVLYNGTGGIAVMVDGGNSSFTNVNGVPADPVDVAESSLIPPMPVGAANLSRNRQGSQSSQDTLINSAPQW